MHTRLSHVVRWMEEDGFLAVKDTLNGSSVGDVSTCTPSISTSVKALLLKHLLQTERWSSKQAGAQGGLPLHCPPLYRLLVCAGAVVGLCAGAGRDHTERCGSFPEQRREEGVPVSWL